MRHKHCKTRCACQAPSKSYTLIYGSGGKEEGGIVSFQLQRPAGALGKTEQYSIVWLLMLEDHSVLLSYGDKVKLVQEC